MQVHLSCYALARRGYNLDMIAVYKGPGGVGLSLLSGHIDAMEDKDNRKFFDINVLVVDDELRKCIELLHTGYVLPSKRNRRVPARISERT